MLQATRVDSLVLRECSLCWAMCYDCVARVVGHSSRFSGSAQEDSASTMGTARSGSTKTGALGRRSAVLQKDVLGDSGGLERANVTN